MAVSKVWPMVIERKKNEKNAKLKENMKIRKKSGTSDKEMCQEAFGRVYYYIENLCM